MGEDSRRFSRQKAWGWLAAGVLALVGLLPILCAGATASEEGVAVAGGQVGESRPLAEVDLGHLIGAQIGRVLLGKSFAHMMQVFERCEDLEAAIYVHVLRGGVEGDERRALEGVMEQAAKRRPSLQKSWDAVSGALGGWEGSLSGRYPKARLRPRLVVIVLRLPTIEADVSEPISMGLWEVLRRSDISLWMERLKGVRKCATAESTAEKAGFDGGRASPASAFDELERDQPVLILWRVRWVPLVDKKLARSMSAEELTVEALRRAPPTAAVSVAYQVLGIPGHEAEGAESVSLETATHEFGWTPDGWSVEHRRRTAAPH